MLNAIFVKNVNALVSRDDLAKASHISTLTLAKVYAPIEQKDMAMLPDIVTRVYDRFCEDGETRISTALSQLEVEYAQKWAKMSPEQYRYRDGTTVEVEVVYELQHTPTFICT